MNKYSETIIKDLKLHDAVINNIKYLDNEIKLNISCIDMKLESYFKDNDIDNIIIEIIFKNVTNLSFDFDNNIIINELIFEEKDDCIKFIINNGELRFEAGSYIVNETVIKKRTENAIRLDNFFKSNI